MLFFSNYTFFFKKQKKTHNSLKKKVSKFGYIQYANHYETVRAIKHLQASIKKAQEQDPSAKTRTIFYFAELEDYSFFHKEDEKVSEITTLLMRRVPFFTQEKQIREALAPGMQTKDSASITKIEFFSSFVNTSKTATDLADGETDENRKKHPTWKYKYALIHFKSHMDAFWCLNNNQNVQIGDSSCVLQWPIPPHQSDTFNNIIEKKVSFSQFSLFFS